MHRVPECLSLRRNLVPPPLPLASECVSLLDPTLDPKGGQHSLAGEGPNSDDWTESLALCTVYSCGTALDIRVGVCTVQYVLIIVGCGRDWRDKTGDRESKRMGEWWTLIVAVGKGH
jgi:hypothetical protein